MISRISVVAAMMLALAAPVSAQNVTRQIPVDANFSEGTLGWNQTGAKYEYRINIIVVNGVLEFCGVGASNDIYVRRGENMLLRGAKLKMNGRTILQDFSFFARARSINQLNRSNANCRSTGVAPPRGNVEWDIDWPSVTLTP